MDEIRSGGVRLLSVKKAAQLVGYEPNYIAQLVRQKRIDAKRIGRAWFVDERSLLSYKESHKNGHHSHVAPQTIPQVSDQTSTANRVEIAAHYKHSSSVAATELLRPDPRPEAPRKPLYFSYLPDDAPLIPTSIPARVDLIEIPASPEEARVATPEGLAGGVTAQVHVSPHVAQGPKPRRVRTGVRIPAGAFAGLLLLISFTALAERVPSLHIDAMYERGAAALAEYLDSGTTLALTAFDAFREFALVVDDRVERANVESALPTFPTIGFHDEVAAVVASASYAADNFFNFLSHEYVRALSSVGQGSETLATNFLAETRDAFLGLLSREESYVRDGSLGYLVPSSASFRDENSVLSPRPQGATTVIERIVERSAPILGVTEEYVRARLNELNNKLSAQIYAVSAAPAVINYSGPAYSTPATVQMVALTNKIDQLDDVTLTNVTFGSGTTITGLTNASIPDDITASNYLPLAGGTLTGALTNTSTATSSFYGGLSASVFSATSTTATSTFANGITLTGGCFLVGGACVTAGGLASTDIDTSAELVAILTDETGTAGALVFNTGATLASTTLTGNFVFGNATGTNATTTSLFSSVASTTLLFANNATSTTFFAATASSTNLFTTSATTTNFAAKQLNITGTAATSTFAGGLAIETSGLVYDYQTNRVGIGTAGPTVALDVTGAITASATSTGTYFAASALGAVGSPAFTFTNDSNTGLWSSTADTLNLSTGGSERLRIDSSGNVGIGTTSPWSTLSARRTSGTTLPIGVVEAAIASFTGTVFQVENTLAAASTFNLFAASTDSDGDAGGRTTQFVIRGDGYVGIGTTSPWRKLSVTDTSAQLATAYDSTRYTTFSTDSAGDLTIDAQGGDVNLLDENLFVCTGGACPTGSPSGTGNLLIETRLGVASSTPWGILSVEQDTETYSFLVGNNGSSTPSFSINGVSGDGRIGIGSTTPFAKLSIGADGAVVTTEKSLTDGATISVAWTNGNQQRVTLGGNRTINFSGYTDGQTLRLIVCQDGTGSRTVTWGDTALLWAGGSAPTLTTTANKCDVLTFLASLATSTRTVFGSSVLNF